MNAIRYVQLFFYIIALPVMCFSVSTVSAQPGDETGAAVSVDKPMSYAEYLRTQGPVDVIPDFSETAIEEVAQVPEKNIIISLADQRMWVFENGNIVQRFLVSTGTWGHRTPTGDYQVHNRALSAYSQKYDAWMLHWMAITSDGQIGMHALQGTSYLRHLGSVASHGCIRLSHEDAIWLYGWVAIGTPVQIVDDYTEPPEEKDVPYRTGKAYCL